MSLREEQCQKVCRILDDVLANRPTERDSLIAATRSAFSALSELHWIPCSERLPEVSGCYLVSVKNDHKRRYSKTAWFGKDAWFARQDVIAWMPLPEPFKGVTT